MLSSTWITEAGEQIRAVLLLVFSQGKLATVSLLAAVLIGWLGWCWAKKPRTPPKS